MFVRNNTKCPNCGSCKTFDVTGEPWSEPVAWCMHYECIACGWGLTWDIWTVDLYSILGPVFDRHRADLGHHPWLRRNYDACLVDFESLRDEACRKFAFVAEFGGPYLRRKSVTVTCLLDDPILANLVSYFVSKPDRKRRFKTAHLLRTVGL